jgi:hypothetical protein
LDWLDSARLSIGQRILPKDADDNPRLGVTARGSLGTIADFCGVGSVLVTAWAVLTKSSLPEALLAGALAVLAFIFMGLNFNLQRKFARESRRANAGPVLVTCHDRLRDASVALDRGDRQLYVQNVALAAKELANAFSQATKFTCRVTIQDVYASEDDDAQEARITTICRSTGEPQHGSREASLPSVAVAKENTDFLRILKGAPHFFSNDITKVKHYKNSHVDVSARPGDYPYRSVIVWPIVGPHSDPQQTTPNIIGFLCVDAVGHRAFAKALDVPTGKSVASAMYSSLNTFRTLRETEMANQTSTTEHS